MKEATYSKSLDSNLRAEFLQTLCEKYRIRAHGVVEFIEMFLTQCESSIEQRLLFALWQEDLLCGLSHIEKPVIASNRFLNGKSIQDFFDVITQIPSNAGDGVVIFPQARIGRYRVDFLIMAKISGLPSISIAIECDGHDFHEKTKEQAQRDKSRDRWLQSNGCSVLRFTGSEIYKSAEVCAQDIAIFINSRLRPLFDGVAS